MLRWNITSAGVIELIRETSDGIWRGTVAKGDAAGLAEAAPELSEEERAIILGQSGDPDPPPPPLPPLPPTDQIPDPHLLANGLMRLNAGVPVLTVLGGYSNITRVASTGEVRFYHAEAQENLEYATLPWVVGPTGTPLVPSITAKTLTYVGLRAFTPLGVAANGVEYGLKTERNA